MKFYKLYLNLLNGEFSGTLISEDGNFIKVKNLKNKWEIQPYTNNSETLNKFYG